MHSEHPANDETGRPGRPWSERHRHLRQLVDNLEPGADGRAGLGAIFRELEAIAPGSIDREAARRAGQRLGLRPLDLSVLDYPEPA